jgi:cbb3-type cytochrome oxidase maturation protein
MDEATIAITVMSGLFGLIFLGFFIWGFATGQFRNVEEASRRMLQNTVQGPHDPSDPKTNKKEVNLDREDNKT